MTSKQTQPWIPLDKIDTFVQIEPALIILCLVMGAWVASKIFLKDLSQERRRTLQTLFTNLGYHLLFGVPLFVTYLTLDHLPLPFQHQTLERILSYVGFCTILSGSAIFVKVSRILVFEYFFLRHMKVAFPVLLVNLFTLLLSLIIGFWIAAELFNIRLTPILATSAIFSLVMGLALQDTLGNLFAGVALQFDKPYEIGDWIEIQSTGQKWVGQVLEISWRATVLVSFTDEAITVPNRIMAQAQISNYSTKYHPIIRSQVFRLPFGSNTNQIKELLAKTATTVVSIRKSPAPFVIISETSESWVGFKLVYYIDHFGSQFLIADEIYSKVLAALETAGVQLASHRITLTAESKVETSAVLEA